MGDAGPPRETVLCLLSWPEDKNLLDKMRKKHPNVEFVYKQIARPMNPTPADMASIPEEYWKGATILVTFATLPQDPKNQCPNLKLLHLSSAGVNRLPSHPIWKERDITITNSSGVHGPQISEWVILQLLSASHKQKTMLQWQKEHIWGPQRDLGTVRDGVGQRLGVLGYGAIGRQTANIAQTLGMDVIAYTASPRKTPESRKDKGKYIVPGTGDPDGLIPSAWYSGLDKSSLHHFLSQSIDVLLVSVPLTPQTLHFLAAEEFAILGKSSAFVVNIARGSILQQDDLIAALKNGSLRGAALDVTDPEPLPEDSELWGLENVAITPHVSGVGTAYLERSFAILDQNLTHLEEGERLINVVDREKGY